MKWLNVGVLVSLLAFQACTKGGSNASTPEGALDAYVHAAFNAKSVDDSQKLLDLSTGEAKEWLSSMPKESFEKQFVKNNMHLLSMSTKEKMKDANGDVSLVYEINFKDGNASGDPTKPAEYSVKKIAYLTDKDGGQWKIKATKNVKTFIERKDDLDVMEPTAMDKKPEANKK